MQITAASTRYFMTYDDVADFTAAMFASLTRADQRRWAEVYVRGLLCTAGKKSLRNMAATIKPAPAPQSLQQFLNQSPWDWSPVRRRLADRAIDLIRPSAWIVERAVTSKRGGHSVGVERRFVREKGRMLNCQLGYGVFATSPYGSLPTDWQLELPETWIVNDVRRRRAGIPDTVIKQSAADIVLSLVDRLPETFAGQGAPLVAQFTGHDEAAALLKGLTERKRSFIIEVDGGLLAQGGSPHYRSARITAPAWRKNGESHHPVTLRELLLEPRNHKRQVILPTVAENGRIPVKSLTVCTVRLTAIPPVKPFPQPAYQLIAMLSPGRHQPTRFWLTNVPHAPVRKLMGLDRLRVRSKECIGHLESELGLNDFEGRSYAGWHHHMTLMSAAAVFAASSA